jgi:hypothetical protein
MMNRIVRDDRVLPETRVVSALIVPFLIAGFVILYLFPDDTGRLFAWTIEPSMTPLVMGAGYVAGAYFLARGVRVALARGRARLPAHRGVHLPHGAGYLLPLG